MWVIQRLEGIEQLSPIADQSLVAEQVILRIGRTGFSLAYHPRGTTTWRTFPPAESYSPFRSMALFGAYEGQQLIGWAAVRTDPGGWGIVTDLRVDAPHRRHGVGRALLDSCANYARIHGMFGLRLASSDNNPVLCQFCQHCGFQLGGIDRMELAFQPSERNKPVLQRACSLFFYRPNE